MRYWSCILCYTYNRIIIILLKCRIFLVALFACYHVCSVISQELYKIKTCPKNGLPCRRSFDDAKWQLAGNEVSPDGNVENGTLDIKLEDAEFYKVYTIEDLFAVFQQRPNATYILNGGNTAHGNCEMFFFICKTYLKNKVNSNVKMQIHTKCMLIVIYLV